MARLVDLIHCMGVTCNVTHLICNASGSKKYRYAKLSRLQIARPSWVLNAWYSLKDVNFTTTTFWFNAVIRVNVFDGQRMCFLGVSPEDKQEMIQLLEVNGGI